MRSHAVFFLVLLRLTAIGQTLQIQPKEIRAGESATLAWNTRVPAFVIGYGKVEGKASARIAPTSSTDFIMVSETATGIQYSTQRLLVSGAKGDDGYPSLSGFDIELQGKRSGVTYINFQDAVWTALQNKGYGVKGDYVPRRPFVIFFTDFALRPDLVSKDEKIRARRLAFAVDIYQPEKAGTITFGVRPRLEFQYRGESEWRPDRETLLAKSEAQKVLQLLASGR